MNFAFCDINIAEEETQSTTQKEQIIFPSQVLFSEVHFDLYCRLGRAHDYTYNISQSIPEVVTASGF